MPVQTRALRSNDKCSATREQQSYLVLVRWVLVLRVAIVRVNFRLIGRPVVLDVDAFAKGDELDQRWSNVPRLAVGGTG